jgi:acylglycerol lipase
MIYNHDLFQGSDGLALFDQTWMPEEKCRAILVLVHGLGEHSGRYEHVAEFFTSKGIGIATYDLRGHGKSDGLRAYVNSIDEHLRDLDIFYQGVLRRHPDVPLFLYGHSMGATIATLYTITRQPQIAGLLVTGALIRMGDDISPMLIKMSGIIGKYAPKMKTTKLNSASISRDPKVVEDYDKDPLNYRQGIPARTGYELILAMNRIQAQMETITCPILIMVGSGDKMTSPVGSQDLYDGINSPDKTIKSYDGFYHEIHNDPEKQHVFADMLAWLNTHI